MIRPAAGAHPSSRPAGRFTPRASAATEQEGGEMVEMNLTDADRLDWALKAFKRKVQRAGVLQDLRRKRHYVKPSEARQIKSKAARRRKRRPAR
jgi:small subunit ribosomal protein S21